MADLIKVTLNITQAEWKAIEMLAAKKGTTKTSIIRRAIGTMKYIEDANDKGQKILVELAKGEVRELVFQ